MTKRLRNILTVTLTLLFLGPSFVQLLDAAFHHHDRFICTAKHDHHFHVYHKKCEISAFELSHFTKQKTTVVSGISFTRDDLILDFFSNHFTGQSEYSFLLRAPPA